MTRETPAHHLPETLLQAYAAGQLSEAFSLVAACHISLCATCRDALSAYETLGGAMIEDLPNATLDETAFSDLMARISAQETPTVPQPPRVKSAFPAPLQDYAGADPKAVHWRNIGGGVRQAQLKVDGPQTARLLFIPAGKAVPEHSHHGLELTLVLQGAFADKVSRFARGDLEIGDSSLEHQPIAEAAEDCICLAATDAPLRFKGLIPRLVQPFVGI